MKFVFQKTNENMKNKLRTDVAILHIISFFGSRGFWYHFTTSHNTHTHIGPHRITSHSPTPRRTYHHHITTAIAQRRLQTEQLHAGAQQEKMFGQRTAWWLRAFRQFLFGVCKLFLLGKFRPRHVRPLLVNLWRTTFKISQFVRLSKSTFSIIPGIWLRASAAATLWTIRTEDVPWQRQCCNVALGLGRLA